jgi:hypothetical protein
VIGTQPAAADADLGPSWLSSTPDGAAVTRREISECTVAAVFDGHFSYRVKGRRKREHLDMVMVADCDMHLVEPGARFWRVAERIRGRGGEARSAIRFVGPGARTVEEAFAAEAGEMR